MKKSSALVLSPAMELPAITKKFTRRVNRRKISQQSEVLAHQVPLTVPPPTEEVIEHLNRIGQEYPFCIYYKQKINDPL